MADLAALERVLDNLRAEWAGALDVSAEARRTGWTRPLQRKRRLAIALAVGEALASSVRMRTKDQRAKWRRLVELVVARPGDLGLVTMQDAEDLVAKLALPTSMKGPITKNLRSWEERNLVRLFSGGGRRNEAIRGVQVPVLTEFLLWQVNAENEYHRSQGLHPRAASPAMSATVAARWAPSLSVPPSEAHKSTEWALLYRKHGPEGVASGLLAKELRV